MEEEVKRAMETHLAGIVITTHHLRQKPPRKDNRRAFELTGSTVDKGFTHSSQDKFVYLSLYLLLLLSARCSWIAGTELRNEAGRQLHGGTSKHTTQSKTACC